MAKQKVRLADNIARVIFVDPDATKGATLGTNVFLPNGTVASPASLREYIGIGGANSALAHSALSGLQVGNDHPQYPMRAGREKISGQWDFTKQVWGADGTAAAPEFSFTSDTDTGVYRVAADRMGLAAGGTQRAEVGDSVYFGLTQAEATGVSGLALAGTAWYGLTRSRLVRVAAGASLEFIRLNTSLAAPSAVALNDTLGAFTFNGYDGTTVSQGAQVASIGTEAWTGSARGSEIRMLTTRTGTTTLATSLILGADYARGPDGTPALPGWSFGNDTDTGIYRIGANTMGLATAGSLIVAVQANGSSGELRVVSQNAADLGGTYVRFMENDNSTTKGFVGFASTSDDDLDIINSETNANVVFGLAGTGQVMFPAGAIATPSIAFATDPDTGLYRGGANIMKITAGAVDVFGARLSGTTRICEIGDGSSDGEFHFRGAAGNNRSFLFYTGVSDLRWAVRANSTAEAGSDAGSDFDIVRVNDAAGATTTFRIMRATGQVLINDGTNSLPQLSWISDPDTGFYRSGSNQVSLSSGGAQSIVMSSTSLAVRSAIPVQFNNSANDASVTVANTGGAGANRLSTTMSSTERLAVLNDALLARDGTNSLPGYSFISDPNTGVWGTGSDVLAFSTAGAEAMRITAAAEILMGHTTALSATLGGTAFTPALQRVGNAVGSSAQLNARFQNSNESPILQLAKGRSGTVGTFTVVQADDALGRLSFAGADGTDFAEGSRIEALVDGTPGSNDMPTRLQFLTSADGSQDPTERLRITSTGAWGLAGANYGTAGDVFTSNGSASAPTWQAPTGGASGANPSASVGLAAVNGVAATFMRSDGAPALSQSIVPTWTGLHTFTASGPSVVLSAANAELRLNQTTGAADNKLWYIIASAETLGMGTRTDAGVFGAEFMTVNRTGTTVDSIAFAATAITLNGVAASDFARLSAVNTFTASQLYSLGTPQIDFNETDAAADNRRWRFYAVAEQLTFDVINDALSSNVAWLAVNRTANTIDSITLSTALLQTPGIHNGTAPTGTTNAIASGTYTPTATAELNLDSVTGAACQWIRVGNVVHVSGSITIDPTAAAGSTTFRITLPVASNLSAATQLGGAGSQNYTNFAAVMIRGDTTNDAAQFVFTSGGSSSSQIYFSFSYVVL